MSSKLRILIVEDELLIAESLKIMLEQMGHKVVAVFMSGSETLQRFKAGLADVVFMDIHLAGNTSGIETATLLKKICDVPVIYLTQSQDEYLRRKAIHETNAVDYICKPFTRIDIAKAIDFALKQLDVYGFEALSQNEPVYLFENDFFLKNGMGYKKIAVDDIIFLKAEGSYCKFIFKDKKVQIFSENLSYFGEKLAFAKELLRVNRSYIVNANFIERVHENRIWINGLEIPISKNYKSKFIEKFRFV
jgi:DNA-binding LytR/AlgR family response regulator